jgi:hypothetical protein
MLKWGLVISYYGISTRKRNVYRYFKDLKWCRFALITAIKNKFSDRLGVKVACLSSWTLP